MPEALDTYCLVAQGSSTLACPTGCAREGGGFESPLPGVRFCFSVMPSRCLGWRAACEVVDSFHLTVV